MSTFFVLSAITMLICAVFAKTLIKKFFFIGVFTLALMANQNIYVTYRLEDTGKGYRELKRYEE